MYVKWEGWAHGKSKGDVAVGFHEERGKAADMNPRPGLLFPFDVIPVLPVAPWSPGVFHRRCLQVREWRMDK